MRVAIVNAFALWAYRVEWNRIPRLDAEIARLERCLARNRSMLERCKFEREKIGDPPCGGNESA